MHIHAVPFLAIALVVLPLALRGCAEYLTVDTLGYWTAVHLAMSAATIVGLQFITAPFGKHAINSKVFPTVDAYVSWAVQESPTVLSFVYVVLYEYPAKQMNMFDRPHEYFGSMGTAIRNDVSCLLGTKNISCDSSHLSVFAAHVVNGFTQFNLGVWLFLAHYLHRTVYYPWLLWRLRKSESKARPAGLKPVRSSTPVPIPVPIAAFLYCLFNGRLQMLATLHVTNACAAGNNGIAAYAAVFICYVVFFFGMRINMKSDYYLMSLRVSKPFGEYKIPHGGLFDRVSCPNFFGEWIEWVAYGATVVFATSVGVKDESCFESVPSLYGISIQAWAALSFNVYVLANLLPRARSHHAWYLEQFGSEYAQLNRKAMIPGVF